jgi:hypothetical protein
MQRTWQVAPEERAEDGNEQNDNQLYCKPCRGRQSAGQKASRAQASAGPRASTTRPSTMREAGDARSSLAPCSVASVRKAAAVSKLIFRNGERLQSMPSRLHAR